MSNEDQSLSWRGRHNAMTMDMTGAPYFSEIFNTIRVMQSEQRTVDLVKISPEVGTRWGGRHLIHGMTIRDVPVHCDEHELPMPYLVFSREVACLSAAKIDAVKALVDASIAMRDQLASDVALRNTHLTGGLALAQRRLTKALKLF